MRGIHVVILLVLVAVGGGAAYLQMNKPKPGETAVAPVSGPPADAVYIPVGVLPADVINADQAFVGQWVPEPGWLCGVESVTKHGGEKAVRVSITQPNPMGGMRWLVVVVPEETYVSRGDFCNVVGRIDAVETFKDGGIAPPLRVLLKDARITPRPK